MGLFKTPGRFLFSIYMENKLLLETINLPSDMMFCRNTAVPDLPGKKSV